jgi:hypothetical protein
MPHANHESIDASDIRDVVVGVVVSRVIDVDRPRSPPRLSRIIARA